MIFIHPKLGYNKTKKLAKRIYQKIGKVLSPPLNDYIYFTMKGFNHLIRKARIRSKREQKDRFRLVPFLEKVIKNPGAIIQYRQEDRRVKIKKHSKLIEKKLTIQYWGFAKTIGPKMVKVVIRQIGKGQKHFYSVMSDKIGQPKNRPK